MLIVSVLVASLLPAGMAWCAEADVDGAHTVAGIVMELRSGTADVPVCLCDGETGLPVAKADYRPMEWDGGQVNDVAAQMAIVVTDQRGRFRFEGVPDGRYRLVAQRWIGPYRGLLEVHGTIIQLMGTADDVVVPRPDDAREALISLSPPGDGIVQFNQDVPNNETFLFLSTAPPEFDPILGLHAMGASFLRSLVGVNRMPLGKTTVIGAPRQPLYAYVFAADNSPGYAALTVPVSNSGLVTLPPEPFVAGWSDGRKSPPAALVDLMAYLDATGLTSRQLLNLSPPRVDTYEAHRARMQELMQELSRRVELPNGTYTRVGDLLAVERYRQLNPSSN